MITISNYYIDRFYKSIVDNDIKSEVVMDAKLCKNSLDNPIYSREIVVAFDKNRNILIGGPLSMPDIMDDESAILLFELMEGSELVYGK